jgi:hypothetical protein
MFFDMFDKLCAQAVTCAEHLLAMLKAGPPFEANARRIKTLEHEADEVVHSTFEHLHKTFVTPLDRVDIRKLLSRLDDILDLSEAAASRIDLYLPREIQPEAVELAEVLVKCAVQVREMVGLLRHLKKHSARILELSVEVNRLENEADHIRRACLARIFRAAGDPLEVMKWKDILEHIEAATDRAEDVADIVEGIVHENS